MTRPDAPAPAAAIPIDAINGWRIDVQYTFDDFKEAANAHQKMLIKGRQGRAGAGGKIFRGVFGWVLFIVLAVILFLMLSWNRASRGPAPALPTPPFTAPPLTPAPATNLVSQIVVPLIPWLLIFGFIWIFVFRALRRGQSGRSVLPVETQITSTKSSPFRGLFSFIILLIVVIFICVLLLTLIQPASSNPASPPPSPSDALVNALVTAIPWLLIVIFIWLVVFRGVVKANVRRSWEGQPLLHLPSAYTFTPDEIVLENAMVRSHIRWLAVLRFVETPNLFLLYLSDLTFHMIPKRSILAATGESAAEQFRAMLRERVQAKTGGFTVLPSPAIPIPPAPSTSQSLSAPPVPGR